MEVSKCGKIAEFPTISIKMKNCKTFYEAKTTIGLKEIIQPPPTFSLVFVAFETFPHKKVS